MHQSALPTECFWSPCQTGTTIKLQLCRLLEASSLNAGWRKNYPREELLCTLHCCPLWGAVRLHAPKSSSSASPHSTLHRHHPNSTVLCSLFVDPCEKKIILCSRAAISHRWVPNQLPSIVCRWTAALSRKMENKRLVMLNRMDGSTFPTGVWRSRSAWKNFCCSQSCPC